MEGKQQMKPNNTRLHKATIRNGIAQLSGAAICTAVLFLFVALTYSQITLPRYTTAYPEKEVQQVVNFIIPVVAVVIGILLSHCRRLTNEAETKSELRHEELTIPRLHVHFEAAGGSKAAMSLPAFHNKEVWFLVAFYFIAMIIFAFLNSVLSVIFVIEAVISDKGVQMPAYIPISVDIPEDFNGRVVDPCSHAFAAPGCTYDLALNAFTSQLINYQPYTVAGVTFEPPNGTLGLPYWAMAHFSNEVKSTSFQEEYRRYCLPVMDPNMIHCEEVPFDQEKMQTKSNLVRYEPLKFVKMNESASPNYSGPQSVPIEGDPMYKITIDYPSDSNDNIKYRTNDQGHGTMLTYENPANIWESVIAASDNGTYPEGYASMLYHMMYGEQPDTSSVPEGGSYFFVAKCTLTPIADRDNYRSSWREVDFTLKNGILRANATEQRCPNPRKHGSGFVDLDMYLQGSGAVISSSDGYSKIFNRNRIKNKGQGSPLFDNMSRLDAVVNQMYHIVQTAWSQQTHKYAMLTPAVTNRPVIMTSYPHEYVIRLTWTPTTYIGLALSILITLNAYVLAGRWFRAMYRFGFDAESWNLLRPVDLMAYSLAAYQDLVYDLNTVQHRRAAMRGQSRLAILREFPIWQGTQNLIGLVSSSVVQSPASSGDATGPIGTVREKFQTPQAGDREITVRETERDLESGNGSDRAISV